MHIFNFATSLPCYVLFMDCKDLRIFTCLVLLCEVLVSPHLKVSPLPFYLLPLSLPSLH